MPHCLIPHLVPQQSKESKLRYILSINITLQILVRVLLALYLKQTLYPSQRQLTGVSFILLWVLTSELDKYI